MHLDIESPQNYEQKCLCVLVLDVSGSMAGEPIRQLNEGIRAFQQDILNDSTTANRLEISVVTFDTTVRVPIHPILAQEFTPPTLSAGNSTALVDGVLQGIQVVHDRKNWYRQTRQKYYRPWVILITDGVPDAGQDIQHLASTIQTDTSYKAYNFFAVGVDGADMALLQKISTPDMPPAFLKNLRFSEFFKWLSASMTTITQSREGQAVDLSTNARAWMGGFKI